MWIFTGNPNMCHGGFATRAFRLAITSAKRWLTATIVKWCLRTPTAGPPGSVVVGVTIMAEEKCRHCRAPLIEKREITNTRQPTGMVFQTTVTVLYCPVCRRVTQEK